MFYHEVRHRTPSESMTYVLLKSTLIIGTCIVRVGGIQIILKVLSLNNVFLSGTNRQACGKGDPTGQ